MAKNGSGLLIPAVAIGSLALGAFLAVKLDIEDWFDKKDKKRGRKGKKGMMNKIRGNDETYLITDESFSKLDIGKKPLNMAQKMKDAKTQRVVYGDTSSGIGSTFAGFVNTVSPYGQGPSRELTRLGGFSDQSRVNTFGNSINLY